MTDIYLHFVDARITDYGICKRTRMPMLDYR
eukprot:COSAG05_NODE_2241_length_3352_cov_2.277283_2_plen_31_part_00